MADLLECVPNFSEGRDEEIIAELRSALGIPGVTLLDVHSDRDHNRSVFTLVGTPEALVDAVYQAARVAAERIDLTKHTGAHPRLGATDVVPFIPLTGTPMSTAVEASRALADRVWTGLSIPVYFYEESATQPERVNLEQVRGKGFEEALATVAAEPRRRPDIGNPQLHPTAGAVITGARGPLIAYNIYLNTPDITIAKAIAKTVRHSGGGLRFVKALGLDIPERGCVQVSMNLTNFRRSAMFTVFDLVRQAAESYGVAVTDSEVVGLLPAAALFDVARHYLRMHHFEENQVLEMRLLETNPDEALAS